MLPESPGRAGDRPGASSRHSETQPAPLPFYRKLCYAIGGAPYQMTGNALGFFLQIFLLDVVQLEPFHSSLILFLGRAWDAVTDPAVGFLVSKSPRRKLGKLIPWIVCSMPFGVVFYCMVWSTPSDAMPVSLKFLWYLAMYCFFQTSMSCYHVPYSSLTMFLGGNPRDRDSATAYRMGVEVFSTLVGSGIQGQIVGRYHASMMKSCSMPNGTLYNSTSPGLTDTLENTRRAYVIASVVLGSLYCMACLILFLGVKEEPGPLSPLGKTQLPFFHSLRIILGHQPYVQLLCGFLFMSLAFQVVASLSIPFWQWFLVHFGKKPAVFVGLPLIIPALIVITQVSHNFLVFVFMVVLAGCSLAVLYLLPWSMLPDAVDDFRLKNPNCLNLEAFFYSFYVFFNKFAGGLSLGISTMSLHFAGYRASDCTHNPSVILTLRILMAPVPITLLLIAMAIFCFYPIDEERRKQMRVEMEAAGSRGLLQGVSLGPPNASEEG
ncbi:sodium-dependent lysophosphatidylcholine symporter 1 isoform X4 [Chelonia mydas]|uniref:sodium-dependent lysophosphatidylcholine symporter 1 isoform X4 n=1 Tax=Chelonia mydas TaxID=8469 RepID=UPI0018A1BB79|nr:sodium-dependent lysophosphatidylcholine symporter 1 isoform X4 [Chelonia mydas]